MSKKELDKQSILLRIVSGELSMAAGAKILNLTTRQLRRCKSRYIEQGLQGLVHKNRGRPSGRAFPEKDLLKIRQLLHERYPDFGPTFAAEKLSLDLGRKISNEKVRQIQIEEGLHKPKSRKKGRYYPRRKRRSREGELIQSDGSPHHWLEDRAPPMTLITFIDDATSKIKHGKFVKAESTFAYMSLTREYLEQFGCPKALYVDKHSVFRQNKKEVRETGRLTNFGRSLSEIGIELICANSPQAKGRVERGFGVLQDRLIKEMRLAGICTMEEANAFLPSFLEAYNHQFGVAPAIAEDAHVSLNAEIDLNLVFSVRETRTLSKNLTFQYEGVLYQVREPDFVNRLRNQKVEVRTTPSLEMQVVSRWGKSLTFAVSEESTAPIQRTLDSKEVSTLWPDKPTRMPHKYHPWR